MKHAYSTRAKSISPALSQAPMQASAKALLQTLMLAAAIILMLAMPAQAHAGGPYSDGDLTFAVTNSSGEWYAIIYGCKDKSSITVPEKVHVPSNATEACKGTDVPVSRMWTAAFMEKENLKTLTINADIEDFSAGMCRDCKKLTTVKLKHPESMTMILHSAFVGCANLTSLPEMPNVTKIEESAFEGCSSLPSLKVGALRTLGKRAFSECRSLKDVYSPDWKIKKIGPYTFYNCNELRYIGLTVYVTEVGEYAFAGCANFNASNSLASAESIGECAFRNCRSMQHVFLGPNLKTIGAQAFRECVKLEELSLPKSLESIGDFAFEGCSALSSVEPADALQPPASFKTIGTYAFANCASLKSVRGLDAVTTVGESAFAGCASLKAVALPAVTELPQGLFAGCINLTSFDVSTTVGNVRGAAFLDNTALESVFIHSPSTVINGYSSGGGDIWPFTGCDHAKLTIYSHEGDYGKWYADNYHCNWRNIDGTSMVTINFQGGGASGSMPSVSAVAGASYIAPENTGFSWPGNAFECWKVIELGTTYAPGAVVKLPPDGGTLTFAAQWKDAPCVVTLKGGGESSATYTLYYKKGASFIVPECTFSASSGKLFKWWYDAENDLYYEPGEPYGTLTGDVTLTAQWWSPVTVQLDPKDGTFSDGSNPVEMLTNKYGELDKYPEVTRDGFDFVGWQVYDNMSHSTPFVEEGTVLATSNYMTQVGAYEYVVKLWAVWKASSPRTVVLDPNGGRFTADGSELPIELHTDDTGHISGSAFFEHEVAREHYKFVTWKSSNADLLVPGGWHYFSTDGTVAAKWEPIKVAKIVLSKTKASLERGDTLALSVMVTPADALDMSVKWTSSDAAVASVSSTGVVTAKTPGTAVITCASTDGGAKAACAVTVSPGLAPDGTAVGAGAAEATAEEFLTSYAGEADPAGSTFAKLCLRASKAGKNSVTLTWKKVGGAKRYVVYGAKCGKKKLVKVATLGAGKAKYTWKKVSGKKLTKGKYYKAIVVAVGADGKVLSTSKMVHAATKGGRVGNHKKVTTKAKKGKVTLKTGKNFKLGAKAVAASAKQKVKNHRSAAVLFESTNPAVATVTKKGVVKAKAGGTCYVYAYAQNGVFAKVKVTVKGKGGASAKSASGEAAGDVSLKTASAG